MNITSDPIALSILVALPLFGIAAKLFGASFRWIAKGYLYITVFAVLVVLNSIFFPFIGGKDYFLRFAVELALMCYILFWAFEARESEVMNLIKTTWKKPLFIAVSLFVLAFLLASFFALDPHAAFWSNYERGEGAFQMLHYYVFFVLLALLFKTEDDWKYIFRFSLIAAGGMILYGLCGNFGVNGFISAYTGSAIPAGIWHKLFDQRFEGSLGNPAYVAPYLMFSMFFAGYLWVRRKAKGIAGLWTHVGYSALLLVLLFVFILSQTRGAFLGLAAGVLALVVYFIFAGRGSFRKWSLIALLLLIAASGAVFSVRNSSFVGNLPAGRLLQISFSDTTAQTRFWVWGEAWKGFLARPVFGWGPENFTAVYDKYFDSRFYIPGVQTETWFDRAHSVYFDYLAETGIVGLLAYLGIFFVFIWEFFRRAKPAAHEGARGVVERGIMIALPVAYLVQGVAIFDVLPMYLSLFLFLAFGYYIFYGSHETHNEHHG